MYGEQWDYEFLKAEAKYRNVYVEDLMALSPSNDPFYQGKPGERRAAKWFTDLWHRFGYTTGVHIRRMHYQIISQDPPVLMPNGLPYENTEKCWDMLNAAAKSARYLEMVSAEAFDDRRNPPPTLYMARLPEDPWVGTTDQLPGDFAELPDFPTPPGYGIANYNASGRQRYLVEVWCEKSTMNDILVPFCERYGFNLQTGLGELSITAVVNALKRVASLGKPTRIIYVSDFDPAGASMPTAVGRKLEYFMRRKAHRFGHIDVRLEPVILTHEQVRRYRLPRTPIKESEKRAARFEQRFGEGAVELDALEALRPGELTRVLAQAVAPYYDRSLNGRIAEARQAFVDDLEQVRDGILQERAQDIAFLQDRYEKAKAQAEAVLGPVVADIRKEWEEILDDLRRRALDPADYPIPEADEADEDDDQLFVSGREYLEQLAVFKRHQGKEVVA